MPSRYQLDQAVQTLPSDSSEPLSAAALATQPSLQGCKTHTIRILCIALIAIWILSSSVYRCHKFNITCGALCSVTLFLVFSAVHFPDGVLVRPHPAFWRFIKGVSILYLCLICFLLFQDVDDVRRWLSYLDSSLGHPLPEKSYAEDCRIIVFDGTKPMFANVTEKFDVFVIAHLVGWMVKAIILRDSWLLWACSFLFEWMEISFQHILPNFRELLLDVFGCNWLGIYFGMRIVKWLKMKNYDWRWIKCDPAAAPSSTLTPLLTKKRRASDYVKRQLSFLFPSYWTDYNWPPLLSSFEAYVTLLGLIFAGTFIDLNLFFIKAEIWLDPSHWILVLRTIFFVFAATAGTRDIYEFIRRPHTKLGMQGWLDLAIVLSELMLALRYWHVLKYSSPTPNFVKAAWISFLILAILIGLWLYIKRRRIIHNNEELGTITSNLGISSACTEKKVL